MSPPARGRGRPATTTADQLARTALALWDQFGYDGVPLSEVAAAAGVNERTLFRYFGSKSDIVWQAIDTSFADLGRHLDSSPPDEPLLTRIRLGVLASFDFTEDAAVTRMRMTIISRTPELHNNSSPPFLAWRTVIQEFAARELAAGPDDLTPRILAASVQAVTMTALIWWGAHSDRDAAEVVGAALRTLEAGFA